MHFIKLGFLISFVLDASAGNVQTWADRVMLDQKAAISFKGSKHTCVEYIDVLVKAANKTATNRVYPSDNMPFFNGHREPGSAGWGMLEAGPYTASTNVPPFRVTLIDEAAAKVLMEDEMVPSEDVQIVFPAGKVMVFCEAPLEPFSATSVITFCECFDTNHGCSSLARRNESRAEMCGTPKRVSGTN